MVALLCYCPSYNHLLLVLYQFPVCALQCAWLLCYATVPLTTTFFWFSISSLCVHYNVHGCSAMLLSLLQPPSSGSLSVPCVSTTMCMVALLCYCPSYNHLLLVLYQFPGCRCNEVNDLTILLNHHDVQIIRHYHALFVLFYIVSFGDVYIFCPHILLDIINISLVGF